MDLQDIRSTVNGLIREEELALHEKTEQMDSLSQDAVESRLEMSERSRQLKGLLKASATGLVVAVVLKKVFGIDNLLLRTLLTAGITSELIKREPLKDVF